MSLLKFEWTKTFECEIWHIIVRKRKKNRFHLISFQVNFVVKKKPFERQDLKMGKAEEKQLVVTVQKYPCLYDEVNLAFHDKNEGKDK